MHTLSRLLAFASALLAVLTSQSGQAQSPRPMTLVELREVPGVLDPQLSPDGRTLIYQLNQVDWKADRRPGHIWRQEVGGGSPVQLTSAESGESSPRWSADGGQISFLRDGQISLMPARGGDARPLTRHATNVAAPTWSPDGAFIYFLASDPRTAEERARVQARDDVFAFDEDYKHRHLWRVAVATGVERALTQGDFSISG